MRRKDIQRVLLDEFARIYRDREYPLEIKDRNDAGFANFPQSLKGQFALETERRGVSRRKERVVEHLLGLLARSQVVVFEQLGESGDVHLITECGCKDHELSVMKSLMLIY